MSKLSAMVIVAAMTADPAMAQTSSLYVADPQPPQVSPAGLVQTPELVAASYIAVALPPPRKFQVHDLVTIIIREDSAASSESSLDTEKENTIQGEVNAFPHLNLYDLITFQKLTASQRDDKTPFPAVDLTFNSEFNGEGEYERRDTLTTRLTARVVDVKPNGTLAVEARTYLKNDNEELTIKVTGYCRPDDVTPGNTVLSTQVFDLRVEKTHTGEVRNANKKGLFTKILDTIFNF